MREILFRGKRIDNGEWIEGSLVVAGDYCCILPADESSVHPTDYPYLDSETGTIDGHLIPVYPSTIGQFTGLTANGKKIFEWYIVRFSTPYCLYTAPIVYQNGVWCADNKREASFTLYSIMKLVPEVIGNIHDNPELLKDKS